jgi:DNA (cytosine-5)-methyltransferase 1
MQDGSLPWFPLFGDVKEFNGKPWQGAVDCVCGGFPCQPFSAAGKRKGIDDERNLWPDTIRIVREVEPRFVFLENVPGLLKFDYFGQILGDLATAGFDAEWEVVSAADLGAPHRRQRLWIFAYSKSWGCPRQSRREGSNKQEREVGKEDRRKLQHKPIFYGIVRDATDSSQRRRGRGTEQERNDCQTIGGEERAGLRGGCNAVEFGETRIAPNINFLNGRAGKEQGKQDREETDNGDWWQTQSGVVPVVHGISPPVDRDKIRMLGNGQVPIVAATAFLLLAQRAGIPPQEIGWVSYPEWIRKRFG